MIKSFYIRIFEWFNVGFKPLAMLGLRWQLFFVFFYSGLAKWNGWFKPDPGVYDLFLYEFFCPEEKRPGALQLCDPATLDYVEGSSIVTWIKYFAVTAGVMEIVLPILLIVGLFTRFAALGILSMTVFIQLAVFPTWSHWVNPAMWWAGVAAALIIIGPGKLSLDYWFGFERKDK
ncbi:DoxX family protein [Leucothrix sargassi]|nr:DoxX family protein [Leucothrix sargassi]